MRSIRCAACKTNFHVLTPTIGSRVRVPLHARTTTTTTSTGLGDQSTANDARETFCSRDTLLLLVLIGMGPSSVPSSVGAISQCGHDRPPWLVQSSKILSRDWRMRMIIYAELVEVAAFIWCLKIGLASADIEKARARGK
jgi:hypothetical protein